MHTTIQLSHYMHKENPNYTINFHWNGAMPSGTGVEQANHSHKIDQHIRNQGNNRFYI